jgi:hypothetical protein
MLAVRLALSHPAMAQDIPEEDVVVYPDRQEAEARAAITTALKEQGYRRKERVGDAIVYKNDAPWKPQVWLHDDGWVDLRRQPPRIHSPVASFADERSKLWYLLCVPTLMTACVSPGGWLLGERKLVPLEEKALEAIHDDVARLNDAVARRHMQGRLYDQIPKDLEAIWASADPPVARRRALFAYWDERTETPDGMAARQVIVNFLDGVVQVSGDRFTAAELAELNGQRRSRAPLVLEGT